jgi:hypothetical protein
MTGFVDKFATILPRRVQLTGKKGAPISVAVKIVPEKKYPFEIQSVKAKLGRDIKVKIEKDGSTYMLMVENIRADVGKYQDAVILKTTSKIQPEIKINVFGKIKE